MPRTGSSYFLPSPPSPYVPGTSANAEDINTSLNDIAAALTGSMPINGSAAMTGPINMNGFNITGAGTISGTALTGQQVTGTTSITSPQYNGGAIDVTGQILTSDGRIISTNTPSAGGGSNPSVTVWDMTQNYAAGMFMGGAKQLSFGSMDGGGNLVGLFAWFDPAGVFNVSGGINAASFTTGGNIVAGYIQSNGNLAVNNEVIAGSILCYGPLEMRYNIQMDGHIIGNCVTINPEGTPLTLGAGLTLGSDLQMAGHGIDGLPQINPGGNLGIAGNLDMQSNYIINCAGVIPPSDLRFKTNVAPSTLRGLDVLERIVLAQFDMSGKHHHIGFIANDLPEELHGVQRDGRGGDYHYVEMLSVMAALTQATQELNRRLVAVEERVRD